jgi:hypothetical protein
VLSSFVEGRPGRLRVIAASRKRGHGTRRLPPMDGSSGPETKVHRGTAMVLGRHASPLLCTAYMSATSQYTPVASLFLCGKRTVLFSGGAPDVWESAHALRAVRRFVWLEVGSVKAASSHLAHQYPYRA